MPVSKTTVNILISSMNAVATLFSSKTTVILYFQAVKFDTNYGIISVQGRMAISNAIATQYQLVTFLHYTGRTK